MNFARSPLPWSYYQLSRPYRLWRNRHDARAGRAPIIVLRYHRIADDRATPWTCPHQAFERQMRWLKKHCDLVSLAEAQQRIRSGANRRLCASVTFDDGYEDNCRRALPLLIRERIPCTYFVSTRFVFRREPFPRDAAAGKRCLPISLTQLRELAAAGIDIGAQTRTHADLGKVAEPAILRDEVVTAGEELQAALRRPVRYFAFPFGGRANLNPVAFHLAYEAGYDGVCSAYGAVNRPGDDAFHIERVDGGVNLLRLKSWITGAPRKNKLARYEYESAAATDERQAAEDRAASVVMPHSDRQAPPEASAECGV